MWDHDQDGGFAGTNACHTSPGFSELTDHLNDPTKAVIVIREINHIIELLLEKLTADSAATFVANYFDSMTQTCLELSGAEPVRGVGVRARSARILIISLYHHSNLHEYHTYRSLIS